MKTSIIMPAYNEEKNIGNTIKDLRKYFKNVEIIVVTDHSTDKTENIAEANGTRVIRNSEHLGSTKSVEKGFSEAKGDILIKTDADGEIKAKNVYELYKKITEADIIIGYKTEFQRKSERIISKIFSPILKLADGADLLPGVIVTKREVYKMVGYDSVNAMGLQFLFKAVKKGYKIKTAPLKFIKREDSRLGYSLKTELKIYYRSLKAFVTGYIFYK